jgi:hypothetical protein
MVGENNKFCEFESIGSAELKGFARPVELFAARIRSASGRRVSA